MICDQCMEFMSPDEAIKGVCPDCYKKIGGKENTPTIKVSQSIKTVSQSTESPFEGTAFSAKPPRKKTSKQIITAICLGIMGGCFIIAFAIHDSRTNPIDTDGTTSEERFQARAARAEAEHKSARAEAERRVARKKYEASPEYYYESNKSMAVVQAQNAVRDSLSAPSTAKFPWLAHRVVNEGRIFTVVSHVDAQNGFGAMIRQRWVVKLNHYGGDIFNVISVNFY